VVTIVTRDLAWVAVSGALALWLFVFFAWWRYWGAQIFLKEHHRRMTLVAIGVMGSLLLLFGVAQTREATVLGGPNTADVGQTELSQTMLFLSQQLATQPGNDAAPVVAVQPLQARTAHYEEATINVRNDSDVPVLVTGIGTITDSSTHDVDLTGVPFSLRWRGSNAKKMILLPNEERPLDVVAYGYPVGWHLPGLPTFGVNICLMVLSSDIIVPQGYAPLLCQRNWWPFWWRLSDREWIKLKVQIIATSLANLKVSSSPQIEEYVIHPGKHENEISIQVVAR